MKKMKKTVRVVAALIRKGDKIFCAERAYGFLKGKWEFPGGKIEEGETPEEALVREIREELDTEIAVDSFYMNVKYEYPDFLLDMDLYLCHVIRGRLEIEEGIHLAEAWMSPEELKEEDWCPADSIIIQRLTKENSAS